MERKTRIGGWQIACGRVPKHWDFHEAMSKLANDALYFCKDRLKNKAIVLKVYTGYRSYRYVGKCYTRVGVICMNEKRNPADVVTTLAHEVAHMAYAVHEPRHLELTNKITSYMLKQGGFDICSSTQR